MTTKDQLQASALTDRGMRREQDPVTGRFSIVDSAVDKTTLMLYTEGIIGKRVEEILLMQMSTRRLAEWISRQIGQSITGTTIVNWRKRFKITKRRRS